MISMNRRDLLKVLPVTGIGAANTRALETTARSATSGGYLLACSQLGFRRNSPKTLTLVPVGDDSRFPDRMPFYAMPAGYLLPRQNAAPGAFKDSAFDLPFDLESRPWVGPETERRELAKYCGELVRIQDRWGPVWQADFSAFQRPGIYQIETEKGFTVPFQIGDSIYERVIRGYLTYVYSQRAGFAVPGIRPAENTDDAVLDSDGTYVPVSGGWFDAGDTRKWMALTSFHLEALGDLYEYTDSYRSQIREEIAWGNRWVQAMMAPDGSVWEDVGGGELGSGVTYVQGWWNENHPGCIAGNEGNRITDNIPQSGDERKIRTTYNPWVQFAFVREQAIVSRILQETDAAKCLAMANRAWTVGVQRGHDHRTLFVSGQLRAGIELIHAKSAAVDTSEIVSLCNELLERQDQGTVGLSHYFLEKDGRDAYRSVAFSCDPPLTLLRLCDLKIPGTEALVPRLEKAVRLYVDEYLLADASSNAYRVTPYGAFLRMPWPELQKFRDAGRGRGVRTFIHPYNDQFMVHGTNGVLMHQAELLARAGRYFGEIEYCRHAEKLLQWSMGHNPTGLSTFTGIGWRHPMGFSMVNLKIPEAVVNGFVGRPDDSPYLETSNVIQWNTQEIWGIPYIHAIGALTHL